jgi:hypothetical protein
VSAAIVPLRPATLPGAGLVQLATGNVACNLQVNGVDRRANSATFELVLANQAPVSVSGRLYGRDRRRREHTFGALEVAARSIGRSLFTVPLDWRKNDDHVYVEVLGDGIHLLLEAQPPALAKPRPAIVAPAAFALGGSVLLAVGAIVSLFGSSAGFAAPSIIALAVPNRPAPGVVNVSYAIQGQTAAAYRATLPDGAVLSSGPLHASNGSIAIAVPPAAAGKQVRITLDANGPLGKATRSAAFTVGPDGAGDPARVLSLTAHRDTYGGDESVIASYSAVASNGVVRVLDERGGVVARAPFTHVGTTRIPLPHDAANQPLRAELDVTRGRSHATSSVELPAAVDPNAEVAKILALREAAQAGGESEDVAATDAADGSVPVEGAESIRPGDPFYVPGRVIGGVPFAVAIRHALPHMRIELQDEMGTVVDERVVSPGATAVTLDAPKTEAVQTYYVAGSFARGASEETVVRSIRIFPH